MEVNLEIVQPYAMEFSSVREAHGFTQTGGVMGAVKAFLKMEADKINAVQVSDLNKKNIATLHAYAKTGGKLGTIYQVMACRRAASPAPAHSGNKSGKWQLSQIDQTNQNVWKYGMKYSWLTNWGRNI